MKAIVSLILLFISTWTFSSDLDSLKIVDLSNQIELLEKKHDFLFDSTSQILNALYVTIGIVLTAFLGLNIWNYVVQTKKLKNDLKSESESEFKKLELQLTKRVNSFPASINSSQETMHKSHSNKISEINLIELGRNSKYISYGSYVSEGDVVLRFLRIAIDKYENNIYSDYAVKQGLIGLIEMLTMDGSFYHTEADDLIQLLNSERFEKFSSYTEKAINLLKTKI